MILAENSKEIKKGKHEEPENWMNYEVVTKRGNRINMNEMVWIFEEDWK